MGAQINHPYKIPNKTLPDGTPGIWTMIGATEAVQEEAEKDHPGKVKNNMEIDCGSKREDEK